MRAKGLPARVRKRSANARKRQGNHFGNFGSGSANPDPKRKTPQAMALKPRTPKKAILRKGEGDHPGQGEESAVPQMPGSSSESGEEDSDKRPVKPGSEKEDDLSKQPGKPSDSEESDLEKGEGKKPGKGEESPGPQMPGSDKESGEEDSDKRPGKPGSEKEDDLSKQPGKPSDSEESDLEKGEGKKPGKDKEETDSQLPEKESVKPEEEESKNGKKARLPIVRTLLFDRDENGTFVLAGKLLADGGGTMEEVGILISEKFSFKDCECKPAEIKGKEGIFRKRLRKLEAGATYYYRAYARNEVGENWGSIRKIKVPKVEERKAWWSESHGDGRRMAPVRVAENLQKIGRKRLDLSFETRLGLPPDPTRVPDSGSGLRSTAGSDAKGCMALPLGQPIRRLALFRNPAPGRSPLSSSLGWTTDSPRP